MKVCRPQHALCKVTKTFLLTLVLQVSINCGFTLPWPLSDNRRSRTRHHDRLSLQYRRLAAVSRGERPWFLDEHVSSLSSASFSSSLVPGPPHETKPDYDAIHGPLGQYCDDVCLSVFRTKLSEYAGFDSNLPGYGGIIELTDRMNKRYSREDVQKRALQVLVSLFPSWMPPAYAVLFSRPFPAFSCRMNAWATRVAGTWLMGECEVNDVEIEECMEDGTSTTTIGKDQGLHVKRCRFLEESGCASVCINSCKLPTQRFFLESMGLPLLMEPNYDTFECQFSFGKMPNAETEWEAKNTPCLSRCPSAGSLRMLHTSRTMTRGSTNSESRGGSSTCNLMDD